MISSKSGRTNVKILAPAAIVMLAAAIGLYQMEETSSSAKFERKKLFKSLNLSDIAEVKITTESDTVDLKKKSENLWGLESRGGYPIENDRLQRLVLAIVELEAADLMTSNKEKYEKMGLKEEKPENGKIQFLDKDAKPLGELYVGAVRNSGGSDEGFKPPDGQYVRVGGDGNVYKIKDQLQVDKLPASWLMRDVLKVEAAHLQSLKLESGKTTDSYTVSRAAADPFKLTSAIPENYKEKTTMVSSVGNCLSNITLNDVLPAADPKVKDIDFSTTLTATQKNGLVYVLSLGKLVEERYLKISAVYDKASDLSLVDERTSDSVTAKLLEKAETAVGKANEKHKDWVYQIANYQWDNIARKFSDLIEMKTLPGATPTSTPAAGPEAGPKTSGAESNPSDPPAAEVEPESAPSAGGDSSSAPPPADAAPPSN